MGAVVTGISFRVIISIKLVSVEDQWAVVQRSSIIISIRNSVVVRVLVTSVPLSIPVSILLARVGNRGAVVFPTGGLGQQFYKNIPCL